MTRWTMDVEESIKTDAGDAPGSLSILGVGATVDDEEIGHIDQPFLRVGERYLVFLIPHPGSMAQEGDYASAAGTYSAFLLRDGQVYGQRGPEASWVPDAETNEAALLQHVRDQVANLSAASE